MFCSNCGKTIRPEDQVCSFCQAPIGDNRFGGIPYTSAQFTIAPGQTTFEPLNNYTRTIYTDMKDAAQEGAEVDSRTTYRPVYEGSATPVDVRRDMRAAFTPEVEEEPAEEEPAGYSVPVEDYSETAQVVLSELDEDLRPDEEIDLSQFRSRPIQSTGRAGISQDVSDYIRKLEDDQLRKGRRRRAAEIYDDYEERDAETEPETYAGEEEYEGEAPVENDENVDGEEYYDDDYAEGDDYEYADERAPRFNAGLIIKIAIAVAVVIALVFGVKALIPMLGNIKNSSAATIEGVTETLYTDGVALIKSQADGEYIDQLVGMYKTNGLLPLTSRLMEDKNALTALLPAEPAVNDSTFISALETIHGNIENAITMDILAIDAGDDSNFEDSANRWQIVSNSIAQLESASSAAELTAIINGQKVTVEAATPEPTATAVAYTPLSNGDKGDDVLKLQNRLYELGYLRDDRDGAFGGKTQTAVKKFQERMGLEVSGIADQQTQSMLYADSALYAEGATTPTPAPTATPEPEPEMVIAPAEVING